MMRDKARSHVKLQQKRDKTIPEKAIKYYASHEQVGPTGATEWWCPVSKEWWSPKEMTVAHIVPFSTSPEDAAVLFGEEHGTTVLASPRDLIPLDNAVEEAYDAGRITIVPTAKTVDSDSPEFELQIVDGELLSGNEHISKGFPWIVCAEFLFCHERSSFS